jgi:hypothetical protein
LSSDLPWPIVSDYGVQHGQQLSGDGDECNHFRLSGRNETVEEGFQDGVVLFGNHCAHEQRAAYGGATSADEAFASPLAGLAGEGGKASALCGRGFRVRATRKSGFVDSLANSVFATSFLPRTFRPAGRIQAKIKRQWMRMDCCG